MTEGVAFQSILARLLLKYRATQYDIQTPTQQVNKNATKPASITSANFLIELKKN